MLLTLHGWGITIPHYSAIEIEGSFFCIKFWTWSGNMLYNNSVKICLLYNVLLSLPTTSDTIQTTTRCSKQYFSKARFYIKDIPLMIEIRKDYFLCETCWCTFMVSRKLQLFQIMTHCCKDILYVLREEHNLVLIPNH